MTLLILNMESTPSKYWQRELGYAGEEEAMAQEVWNPFKEVIDLHS